MTKQEPNAINVILLKDSTKMIYLQEKDNILFDVFWINSFKNIWHIKYLKTDTKYPIGKYVDHFIKSDDGKLEKQESFPSYTFKQMVLKKENNDVDLKSLPLSTLIKKWYFQEFSSRQKKTDLLSQLNYKLALALTPLLIPLAAIPFCLRFSRNISIFSITSIALFMFILFFTTMDASLILAENQVLPSFFIIWLPMVLFFTFFGIVFKKRAV
jgi:lipopolysaccharide export LptBFGC system permease protein LptF